MFERDEIKIPSKRDYQKLCNLLKAHCYNRNGIAAGNAAHKLRCRYGAKYNELLSIANIPLPEFDELMRQWDEEDLPDGKDYSF